MIRPDIIVNSDDRVMLRLALRHGSNLEFFKFRVCNGAFDYIMTTDEIKGLIQFLESALKTEEVKG